MIDLSKLEERVKTLEFKIKEIENKKIDNKEDKILNEKNILADKYNIYGYDVDIIYSNYVNLLIQETEREIAEHIAYVDMQFEYEAILNSYQEALDYCKNFKYHPSSYSEFNGRIILYNE